MLTGVEIAGIILAVAPLCISTLERHESELRPFKALFRYHKEINKSAQDLGVAFSEFEQTIRLVFKDAGVADNDQLDTMFAAFDPKNWNNGALETKLISHFGTQVYHKSYRIIVERILEDIQEISRILDFHTASGADSKVGSPWRTFGCL